MVRRLAALLIALAVTASGQSPCTAAALARAATHGNGHAAYHGHHAAPAHAAGAPGAPCHEPGAELSPRCLCGCTGDVPRAAASAFTAVWALPAPRLAEIASGVA